jgi:hypothetical protein
MARKVLVQLVDDLDGKELGDAGQTVSFSLDGTTFEIDLSEKNAETFRKVLTPYVEAARKVGFRSASSARRSANKTSQAASKGNGGAGGISDINERKAIREWAVEKGLMEADARGRIKGTIIDQYRAEKAAAS